MKKQWLSMILVLCMVLCLAPATARAAESKTGTLRVITEVIGLPDGVSAEGKTFTFKDGITGWDLISVYAPGHHHRSGWENR